MFCPKCGKQIPDEANFCEYCGNKLIEENLSYEQSKKENSEKVDSNIDSGEVDSRLTKKIPWFCSLPILFILGCFGAESLVFTVVAVILLVLRIKKDAGFVKRKASIILCLWIGVYAISGIAINVETGADNNEASVSTTSDQVDTQTRAAKEDGKAVLANEAELHNAFRKLSEWEYPKKFDKERKKAFALLDELVSGDSWEEFRSSDLKNNENMIPLQYERKKFVRTLDQPTFFYFGEMKNNTPNGMGILIYNNYPVFVGTFKKGKLDGYGMRLDINSRYTVLKYEGICDKLVHESGNVNQFYLTGEGIQYYYDLRDNMTTMAEANEYYMQQVGEGLFENGKCNALSLQPAVYYEGEYKNGERSGKGKQYYNLYQESIKSGTGCYGPINYEGEYKDSSRNGKGKVYYYSGQLAYEGELRRGKYNGKGTLYDENGEVINKGKFKNGDIAE